MNKEKFGVTFYKIVLLLTTVFLLAVLLFVKNEDKTEQTIIRYLCCFYAFAFLLPTGLIVREYCLGKYIAKKMMLKIIFSAATLVVGSILIFVFWNVYVTLALLFLGFGLIMFVGVPTIPTDNSTNRKEDKK